MIFLSPLYCAPVDFQPSRQHSGCAGKHPGVGARVHMFFGDAIMKFAERRGDDPSYKSYRVYFLLLDPCDSVASV
jgi:hypothetical protein